MEEVRREKIMKGEISLLGVMQVRFSCDTLINSITRFPPGQRHVHRPWQRFVGNTNIYLDPYERKNMHTPLPCDCSVLPCKISPHRAVGIGSRCTHVKRELVAFASNRPLKRATSTKIPAKNISGHESKRNWRVT